MNWIFFALLAPAIYSINNYLDKYVIEKRIKDYRGISIFTGITGFVIGTLFWLCTGLPVINGFDAAIVLLSGMFTVWAIVLYFKALNQTDTSNVIFMFQLIPVIELILAFIFLKEHISVKQAIGFIIILVASITASSHNKKVRISFGSFLLNILCADLLFSIAAILIKWAVHANTFSKILSYESWGIGLGALVLYVISPQIKKSFHKEITCLKFITLVIIFMNEVIYVFAKAISYYAYSSGPVALVGVLGSTQVFYGIGYGLILTLIFPKIFKEDLRVSIFIQKVCLSILLLLGIYLVV